MSSLPPPAPGVSPGLPAPGPRPRKRRGWFVVAAIGVVAWAAGLTGALVGNQLSDWIDSPPKSASDEPINVSDPRGPIDARLNVAQVIDHMAASVVTISADVENSRGSGQSVGTGVIISSDGEILTNAHVVDGATKIRVRLAGETEPREASLLAADPGNDLALLRMNGDGFDAATFADPDSVHLGDEVVAIGFALGLDGDPVDILLLCTYPLFPGVGAKVRPVGVFNMTDDGGSDAKVIVVPAKDPRWDHIQDVGDIPEFQRKEIEHFFEHYKDLEPGKWVKTEGWGDAAEAEAIIDANAHRYEKFSLINADSLRAAVAQARCGRQGGSAGNGAAQPALEPGLRARPDGIRAPVPRAEHRR